MNNIQVIRKIYIDCAGGEFLTLGPDRETETVLELYTEGEKNESYFGKVAITLSLTDAENLGKALLAAVKDHAND